ncbi:hypothetical protein FKM82_011049 [Ascaphus truei]
MQIMIVLSVGFAIQNAVIYIEGHLDSDTSSCGNLQLQYYRQTKWLIFILQYINVAPPKIKHFLWDTEEKKKRKGQIPYF